MQAYVDESHSKVVGVIPLRRPVEETSTGAQPDDEPGEVIGALIVEQIEDSRPHEGLLPRVEVIGLHASTALANALEYHRIFLLPLWLALGKATWVIKARTLPKTMAIASAVGVLILWLLVWPATFNLEGPGTLEPASKRDVFAGLDGAIDKVLVDHGQFVKRGDELAHLRSSELEASIIKMNGELMSTQQKIRSPYHADQAEAWRRRAPGPRADCRTDEIREQLQRSAQGAEEKGRTTRRQKSHRWTNQYLATARALASRDAPSSKDKS